MCDVAVSGVPHRFNFSCTALLLSGGGSGGGGGGLPPYERDNARMTVGNKVAQSELGSGFV